MLAGNVSAFRDALKTEFPNAEFTEIPCGPGGRALSRHARGQAADAAAVPAATPESLEQGKQILLAAAQAAGGDALQSVATVGIQRNRQNSHPERAIGRWT